MNTVKWICYYIITELTDQLRSGEVGEQLFLILSRSDLNVKKQQGTSTEINFLTKILLNLFFLHFTCI